MQITVSELRRGKQFREENVQTTNYTVTSNDNGRVIVMDSTSDRTVTLPTHASDPIEVGTVIYVYRHGTGNVTVQPAAGVTLRPNTLGYSLRIYEEIYVRKRAQNQWVSSGAYFVPIEATGGIVTDITENGVSYRVHSFTTLGSTWFVVNNIGTNVGQIEYLIVAGGGGGGMNAGAGGGAGGMLTGSTSVSVQTYTITVGDGGAGGTTSNVTTVATNGQNSSALGLTAIGGGAGVNSGGANGNAGGSGGGAGDDGSGNRTGGAGTAGQGFKGGDGTVPGGNTRTGGGGGGAGGAGQNSVSTTQAGNGGIGRTSTIRTGVPVYYAGGGGGAVHSGTGGTGGLGGGGGEDQEGQPNTGGGGGAARSGGSNFGRKGGSGIVVIRYRLS